MSQRKADGSYGNPPNMKTGAGPENSRCVEDQNSPHARALKQAIKEEDAEAADYHRQQLAHIVDTEK